MNANMMTETDFGLIKGNMPFFSEELVFDVQVWMEKELSIEELNRLKYLCER